MMRRSQLVGISAYWFASNLHWGSLLMIIIPSQVAQMDPAHQATNLSLVMALGAVIAMVTPPIVGAYSDVCMSRWGRRRPFMVVGAAINVVGLIMMLKFHTLGLYTLGFLVVEIGNNIAGGAYSGIIPDLVPFEQRGEASGYMAAMTQLGIVVGALVSGNSRVAVAYAVIMVTLIVFLAITLVAVQEPPLRERRAVSFKSMWIDPREYPDFGWVWISRFMVMAGMWCVQPYLEYYMRDCIGHGSPEQVTGNFLALMLLGATITGPLGGRVSDRIGRKVVVYVANAILAVACLLLVLNRDLSATYAIGVIYGLGYGAYYSVDWALGCDVLPHPEEAAQELGVWNVAMVLPQALAPALAGLLLALPGQSSDHHYLSAGYTIIFMLAAALLACGAFLVRNVRKVR
ncbi:MAG: MFS transporter [Candidatus Xenobia bacterium]